MLKQYGVHVVAGIGAIVYPSIFDNAKIKESLLPILEHRGKGQKDVFRYRNLEMGICGGCIEHNERRNIFALLDGNIYNVQEIQKSLQKSGYQWKEKEDSVQKLIVLAYELWGISFIEKLNGDFSIALFDQRLKRFFLIRDRLGKKPLYWAKSSQYFLFSNELKALLSTGIVAQTPSKDGLAAYLFLGYIPQDLTLIKDVNKLLPGYYLQLDLNEKSDKFSVHSYWSLSQFFQGAKESKHSIEEFEYLLKDAIAIRRIDNEKVACFLEGNITSASLAYYLKTEHSNVDAFFAGGPADLELAHQSAEQLSLNFLDCSSNNFLKDLVTLVWFLDEPVSDDSIKNSWELCKQASSLHKRVFSAASSTELLNREAPKLAKESLFSSLYFTIGSSFLPLFRKFRPQIAYSFLRSLHNRKDHLQYLHQQALLTSKEMKYYFPSLFHAFEAEIFLQKFYRISKIASGIPSCVYFDLKTIVPDKILIQYERFSSLHDLCWLTPFLDHRIIEFLVSLPQEENALFAEKLMKDRLHLRPDPQKKPAKNMAAFASIAKGLEDGIIVESGFISERKIEQLIKARPDYLKTLLILEIWLRLFISRPVNSLKESLFTDPFLAKIFSLS